VNNNPHRVILASSNKGKLVELQDALATTPYKLQPQGEFGVADAVEDGLTFVENAIIKARHAARETGFAAIADDSGLVVPALGGAPGIYSSRYSGEGDAANNAKLLAAMVDLEGESRFAWFMCVLVFMRSAEDPAPIIAEGRWYGHIAHELRGQGVFGYDPLFLVGGLSKGEQVCSAAELSLEQKRLFSHRGQAVRLLCEQLND